MLNVICYFFSHSVAGLPIGGADDDLDDESLNST
jgi:hypothetical protein